KLKEQAQKESDAIHAKQVAVEAERIKSQKRNKINADILKLDTELKRKDAELGRIKSQILKVEKDFSEGKSALGELSKNQISAEIKEAENLESSLRRDLTRLDIEERTVQGQIETDKTKVKTSL